ncbi:MAG: hypothetical protein K2K96_00070 [Lachnospiraceae bacterium]|nr:hypothetical protein [Lachnospiraceae bacterium]
MKGKKFDQSFQNRNNKGMMTIEACILIPIIIMISLLVIWLGFFLYNKTLLMECAGIAAIRASQMAEADNEALASAAAARAEELLSQKTVAMEVQNINVSVDYGAVTVKIRGVMQIPEAIFLLDIYQDDRWEIYVEQTAERLRSCSILRTIERIRKAQNDSIEE